jgi:hypothetical protein
VTVIAVIRPDAWNFPLLLHVLGAMLLVGSLTLAVSALALAWRDGSASLVRLGQRALLLGALPAWVLMRAGAEWIASKEDLTDSNDAWIGIGFTTADTGILLLVIAIVLAAFAARRAARPEGSSGGGLARAATALVALMVIGYLVTIWAMSAKPGVILRACCWRSQSSGCSSCRARGDMWRWPLPCASRCWSWPSGSASFAATGSRPGRKP